MTTTLAERSRRLATRVTRMTQTLDDGPAPERPPHRELARRELAAYAARIRLTDLVREHGSPLFVLDVDRVTTQLLALRRELPEAQIHFATTSLPHPAVIRAVDAFGASFAVASRGEIDLLEREGVAIGRCLHAQPVKTVADITGSYLRGIRTFVVDDPDEVAKFRGLSSDFSVLVRLSFPNPGAESDVSSKSGIAPEEAGDLVAALPARGAARVRVHLPRGQPDHVGGAVGARHPPHARAHAPTRARARHPLRHARPRRRLPGRRRRARALARRARPRHPGRALGRTEALPHPHRAGPVRLGAGDDPRVAGRGHRRPRRRPVGVPRRGPLRRVLEHSGGGRARPRLRRLGARRAAAGRRDGRAGDPTTARPPSRARHARRPDRRQRRRRGACACRSRRSPWATCSSAP